MGPLTMDDQTLNLWRQIESRRCCGKKRLWPSVSLPPRGTVRLKG